MKKLYALLLILWTVNTAVGASNYKSIIVNKFDDTKICINLKDEMKITSDADSLFVTGATYDFDFALADIKGWIHSTSLQDEVDPNPEEPPTGIWDADDDHVEMKHLGNHILITNLPANSSVMMCAIDGKVYYNNSSASDSEIIRLENLTPGVYVLVINGQSTKILVK